MRSGSCESLLRNFLKLKLGMMQFRAIKIFTKKDFGMDLVGKREIHCVHEEIIISLTAGDTLTLVSARLARIIANFS